LGIGIVMNVLRISVVLIFIITKKCNFA